MIILPDIHGRTFWKDAIKTKKDNEKVVFLGDYHDPYPQENISTEDSIANFEDILKYKEDNPKDVVLLLGNHDCGYMWKDVCGCRRDKIYYYDLRAMFNDNLDKFDLAYQDGRYLLTHAGVHKQWFDLTFSHINNIDYKHTADILNNWLHVDEYDKESMLSIYSYYRGYGGDLRGSCVWADVREWLSEPVLSDEKLPFYQIFGHTQLVEDPIVYRDWACLDTRNGYRLEGDKLTNLRNNRDYLLNEIS